MIHPTAIVDAGAELGMEVEIGPYAIVGAGAVIGDGSVIQSHAVLEGAVRIGKRNLIGHGSVIGGPPQDLGFKPETLKPGRDRRRQYHARALHRSSRHHRRKRDGDRRRQFSHGGRARGPQLRDRQRRDHRE